MCADGSGARLMIKEIVVTNFKSYYGTQRIGPFHKVYSDFIQYQVLRTFPRLLVLMALVKVMLLILCYSYLDSGYKYFAGVLIRI